jgi:menaquinone-dependent protoporphyrinogen oxidase
MTILVAYASKHGATQGIAERIGATLHGLGHAVEIHPIDAVAQVEGYEAAVIGSAVYYGSWLKEATEFVSHNTAALAQRPVWLFSSGPLGAEIKDGQEQPKEMPGIISMIRPREHHTFFGALDHATLSFPERMVVKAVRAPEGDFRDWNEIEAWADGIARALMRPASTTRAV